MAWLTYTRGTVPTYRVALFLQGLKDGNLKEKDYRYIKLLISNEGKKFWFAWGEKEALNYCDILTQKYLTKKNFKKHFEKMDKMAKKSIKTGYEVEKTDFSKLSDKEFSKFFKKAWKIFVLANTYLGFDIDMVDIIFEKFLYEEFQKEFKGREDEVTEVFAEISTPSCKTYVLKEELALLRVALKKKISAKDIKEICDNFWWTSLGWESIVPKSETYFKKEITKLRKKIRKKLEEDLRHLNSHAQEILDRRKKLFKKYQLSQNFAHLMRVADDYTYLHDLRKEMQVKNIYSSYVLLKEVAKRTGNKLADLEWFWEDEILEILESKKLDKEILKKRKECYFVITTNKKFEEVLGKAGIECRKKELEVKLDNSGVIKGQIGQKGKVKGIVRVCNGAEDALRKVKKGDILVCGMTLPDYVPAMKRAGAIVTDEGGITCHAAIISRELKIPCITGTKIATQVLKDGDRVEVDADKGIVKIIK